MGIFSKDKKTTKAKTVKKTEKAEAVVKKDNKESSVFNSYIIKNPRITEKAAHISDNNVYTFDVNKDATKVEIAKAVKAIYGVNPFKVNVVAVPTKRVFRRTSVGVKGGGRKAYVYLKKGDKIEFI